MSELIWIGNTLYPRGLVLLVFAALVLAVIIIFRVVMETFS